MVRAIFAATPLSHEDIETREPSEGNRFSDPVIGGRTNPAVLAAADHPTGRASAGKQDDVMTQQSVDVVAEEGGLSMAVPKKVGIGPGEVNYLNTNFGSNRVRPSPTVRTVSNTSPVNFTLGGK